MIQVRGLAKSYGQQILFDGADFAVGANERVGLVGRNGHGKTTLFRLILGKEAPDSGTISFPGNYSIRHLSQHIHFTEDTVLREACLGLRPEEDGRDLTYKAETVLAGLGFSEVLFTRDPSELSGGFQVRLNLARLLVSEPDLLLLDEPTNYLDIVSVRWLIRFLKNWKGEMILITHDREFMDSVTTHTMGIDRCRIRKVAGSTEKYYQQIIQEEEIYEKTRMNDEKKRREAEKFIARFRAKASKARAVQSRIKALEKKGRQGKLSEIKTLDFEFNALPFSGKWLLRSENLSFSYGPGSPMLIQGLTFFVGRNDRIGIIGKNGAGKTTLLRMLNQELRPLSGSVHNHPNMETAYFGQTNIERLNPDKTVEQEILDAHPHRNRKTARNICGLMMFEGNQALKKVRVLSGGEKSRVLLGRLLVRPANLLLLDEPTNHLDMDSTDSIVEAIDAFNGAVLIVTHSEMILHAIATRLIVFDGGAVRVFEGTYQDFLDRVGWQSENEDGTGADRKPPDKPAGKKERRRLRAEILSERARILGKLQKRIDWVETSIMDLEESIEKDTRALLRASQESDGAEIQMLSKSLHASRDQINALFPELEELSTEHDRRAREFEERFKT